MKHFLLWCGFAVALWVAYWLLIVWLIPSGQPGQAGQERGQFGDMFGAVNALFTAIALAGLIFGNRLQQHQLRLQQDEIAASRITQETLIDRQIQAQIDLFQSQKDFQATMAKQQKDREAQSRTDFSNNVLRAIRYELEALRIFYDANGWPERLSQLEDGDILHARFALTEEWVPVFKANSAHLGSVDGELSRKIILTHACLKALVEEYRINNDYIHRLACLEAERPVSAPNPVIERQYRTQEELARSQSTRIKKAQDALFVAHRELLAALDIEGIR